MSRRLDYCVAAVNCYSAEQIIAAVKAAKIKESPVIIQVFPWSLDAAPNHMLARIALIKNPGVTVHLDHCKSYDDCVLAVELGFDSVMIDMAHLDIEENIKITKKFVDFAHSRGVKVEAELGRIDGAEDGIEQVMESSLTTFEEAKRFVEETGIDMLAPSIGNIHGEYPNGPRASINLDRLEELSKLDVMLVLHGFSDFDDDLIHECIQRGIRKININATIMPSYLAYMSSLNDIQMTAHVTASIDAFCEDIMQHMDKFGSSYLARRHPK